MQILNNLISCVNPCTSNSESQNICNGRLVASKRLGTAACTKSNKPNVAVINVKTDSSEERVVCCSKSACQMGQSSQPLIGHAITEVTWSKQGTTSFTLSKVQLDRYTRLSTEALTLQLALILICFYFLLGVFILFLAFCLLGVPAAQADRDTDRKPAVCEVDSSP